MQCTKKSLWGCNVQKKNHCGGVMYKKSLLGIDVQKVKFLKLIHKNISCNICCIKLDFLTGFFNAAKLNRNKYFAQSTFTFFNTSVRKKILRSIKIILDFGF